ncbi:LIM homeobox transcription factor 1-beta [Condylostylus longicornis]|uniref:LIM homeobox transcription factor 1-beta n=1 Tax=Condylostylus longicornis TaxID=2530218 RepID=UPI00244E25D8|nr:LIM homeobox transcription factor 1-beta [Condylostylus longicornis]
MLEFYPVPTSLNSNGLMHHQQTPLNGTINIGSIKTLDSNNGKTEVGTIKCEKNYEICEGCGLKIQDRYLMKIADVSWHESCLRCTYCGIQLNHTCYVRDSKILCKMDYDKFFSIKCTRCCGRILPNDMVMRPNLHYIFHLQCFTCCICCQPLQKGEQFLMRGGQLICRHDFEKELYLVQNCDDDYYDDGLLHPHHHHHHHHHHHRSRDGRRGPKRPRTILTAVQRKQFKASFESSPKPCRKVREALAKDTGLSVRVVQVWFQNQRAKMKKIQRKANKDGSKNSDGSDKDKDDKSIKQESPNSEHGNYLGLDGSYSSNQPLNPNLPYSPDDFPTNSNDSFCSSDLSLDGSNFDLNDEGTSDTISLKNLDLNSNGNGGHNNSAHDAFNNLNNNNNNNGHHGHSNSSGPNSINPIDKLYLMQNSYFNNNEI